MPNTLTRHMNPLDYSVWDIWQELVYEGRSEPYANLYELRKHSDKNGTISLTNNKRLFCSGKGV